MGGEGREWGRFGRANRSGPFLLVLVAAAIEHGGREARWVIGFSA